LLLAVEEALPKLAMQELGTFLVRVVMERHLQSQVHLLLTLVAAAVVLDQTLVKLLEPVVQVVVARVVLAMYITMDIPVQ
jgi:hypothetical protein